MMMFQVVVVVEEQWIKMMILLWLTRGCGNELMMKVKIQILVCWNVHSSTWWSWEL